MQLKKGIEILIFTALGAAILALEIISIIHDLLVFSEIQQPTLIAGILIIIALPLLRKLSKSKWFNEHFKFYSIQEFMGSEQEKMIKEKKLEKLLTVLFSILVFYVVGIFAMFYIKEFPYTAYYFIRWTVACFVLLIIANFVVKYYGRRNS
ncbi:MAG: hypothetical protein COT90_03470 [Candidatus Diapherotrites archaeon CG10_big_fil_rev_8_21_14_0_10_31_34]|nr:MAG: hypothetical protein COT90_03470 [Candidatus Diapherotrites archaeon CG10_big_fil_rev_8_21_14_0_10_31_34]